MGIKKAILEDVKEQIFEEINKVRKSSELQYALLDIITSVGKLFSFETSIKVNVLSGPEKNFEVSLDLMLFTIDEVKYMAYKEGETKTKIKGIQKALAQKILSLEQVAELFEVEASFVHKVERREIE